MKITPGEYRTRDGGRVRIVGPHPRLLDMFISDQWEDVLKGGVITGAHWYDNGIHPHNDANDLVERLCD